ncbi:hypothetical protein BDR22DRAFT_195165 [Usnea florida]
MPSPLTLLAFLSTALLVTTTTTTQSPSPPLHTATLHYLPVHPAPTPSSTPHPLAILTYSPRTPHLSTLTSFTPPSNSTSDPTALTSVVVYLDGDNPNGQSYRSSVTATHGFHSPCQGRFRIVLDMKGDVVGASWRSWIPRDDDGDAGNKKGKGNGKADEGSGGRGDFDILSTKPAPRVTFDKTVKGKGVVEKTLLQKYWWVLIGVAVLAMTGGSDK